MKYLKLQDKKILILYPNRDFTTSALVKFLNQKHGVKKGGNPFTLGDVQQYLRRGFLPKPYGHHPIKYIKDDKIGIRLIRVRFDKKVK